MDTPIERLTLISARYAVATLNHCYPFRSSPLTSTPPPLHHHQGELLVRLFPVIFLRQRALQRRAQLDQQRWFPTQSSLLTGGSPRAPPLQIFQTPERRLLQSAIYHSGRPVCRVAMSSMKRRATEEQLRADAPHGVKGDDN